MHGITYSGSAEEYGTLCFFSFLAFAKYDFLLDSKEF
jgi:hypothetical protein